MVSLGEAVIEVGADASDFDRDLRRETRRAAKNSGDDGDDAGLQFGKGFSKGSSRGVKESISNFGQLNFSLARVGAGLGGVVSAIVPVGPALGGVAAGIVAIAGAAAQASGAAVSLGGVLASLGLGAGVSVLASRGLGDAFEAQAKAQEELSRTGVISAATQEDLKAAMDGLAPSAADLVTQVQALAPAWSAMQQAVQGRFFEGVGSSLTILSNSILPTLSARLTDTAGIVNGAIQSFAGFASSEGFVSRLDGVLSTLNNTLSALLPGLGQIGQALFTVFESGLGQSEGIAKAFSDMATRFNEVIQAANGSGALATFFEQAVDIGGTLLGIIGNLGSILGSVFGAGAGVGETLLSVFERVTGTLADFLNTAEAQAGLAEFFDLVSQTGDTIAGLGAVIGPIFDGVFTVLGELTPHINALRDALLPLAITIGENLGVALVGLAPLLGLIAGLIVDLVRVVAPLVGVLVSALGPAIAEIGALFMEHLGPSIESLIPLLAPVIAWLTGVFAAQIVNTVEFIVTTLGGVFQILGGLIDLLAGVFTGDWDRAWTGIKNIFSGVVNVVIGLVKYLWNYIMNPFTQGSAQLRALTEQINANLKASFLDGVNSVVGFFTALPGRIAAAVGGLGSLLYDAGRNVIQGLINGIASMIGRVGSAMANIAGKIRSYLPFSPAKDGPLSGSGNPENSGQKIVDMLASGIDSRVNLPERAMGRALSPLTPTATRAPGIAASAQRAPVAATAAAVEVTQNFFGPTTSGGRLQEMEHTIRYATQARTETIGGVAT
jgi:phage-related protein